MGPGVPLVVAFWGHATRFGPAQPPPPPPEGGDRRDGQGVCAFEQPPHGPRGGRVSQKRYKNVRLKSLDLPTVD